MKHNLSLAQLCVKNKDLTPLLLLKFDRFILITHASSPYLWHYRFHVESSELCWKVKDNFHVMLKIILFIRNHDNCLILLLYLPCASLHLHRILCLFHFIYSERQKKVVISKVQSDWEISRFLASLGMTSIQCQLI